MYIQERNKQTCREKKNEKIKNQLVTITNSKNMTIKKVLSWSLVVVYVWPASARKLMKHIFELALPFILLIRLK